MESEYLQRPHGFRHTIWNCALFFCGLLGGGRKTALVSRVIHGQVSERERKEEGVVSRKDGREATENTLLHLLLDAPSFFLFLQQRQPDSWTDKDADDGKDGSGGLRKEFVRRKEMASAS